MSCVITITTILSRIRFRNTDSIIQLKRRDFARYHGTSPVDTWQKSDKRIYNICSNVILNIMRRRWNKCRISLVMTVCYLRTGSDNGFLSISFSKPMSIGHRKIHRMSFNRNYTSRLHVFSETATILIIWHDRPVHGNVIEVFQDDKADMLYTWQMSPTMSTCHSPREFAGKPC